MTILENYTDQVRDGFVLRPDVDPISAAVILLGAKVKEVATTLGAFPGDESRIVPHLGGVLRYVANLASQIGLSLEQLAIADITELEKTQPQFYSLAGLGVVE